MPFSFGRILYLAKIPLYPKSMGRMNNIWQLQVAQGRLSELVNAALIHGTQIITRDGRPVVKVVPLKSAELSTGNASQSLEQCLLHAPRGAALPARQRRV